MHRLGPVLAGSDHNIAGCNANCIRFSLRVSFLTYERLHTEIVLTGSTPARSAICIMRRRSARPQRHFQATLSGWTRGFGLPELEIGTSRLVWFDRESRDRECWRFKLACVVLNSDICPCCQGLILISYIFPLHPQEPT